jgi:hypothetical protein
MTATLAPKPNPVQVLLKSSNPELRRLNVRETDETLEISGRVSCYYLKQMAQESLRVVAAGRRIVNVVVVSR